ncbi:MAG: type II secretion system F family protein [Zoogloeaceae bacterium]|jgi:type IV pilus assembly protein PilC|nr:type II secretion system F family protein [Zoogloeaceae bacterium]
MLYAYSALNAAGRKVRGHLEAENPEELEARLKRQALFLVRFASARPGLSRRGGIRRRDLLQFAFEMKELLKAGVPLLDALADLRDTPEASPLQEIAAGLIREIEGGATLSEAMQNHPARFPPIFTSLIRAGEASGDLADVFEKQFRAVEREAALHAQARRLLAYPAFVACVMLAATAFLMLYLVPELEIFARNMGQDLPWHARLLFFVSGFLRQSWHVLVVLAFLGLAATVFWLRSAQGDALWLRLPILGKIAQKIALARFADTLATLYAAGVPILDSLAVTRSVVGNHALAVAIGETEYAVREGRNLAGAFLATGLFPPFVVRMTEVGERTGALDTALHNAARFFERDVAQSVGHIEALAEPVLTLMLGALLGWIVLSVIGPIYDIIVQFAR